MSSIVSSLLSFFSAAGDACKPSGGSFLGLPPWYKYLSGSEDAFGKCIPVIDKNNYTDFWLIGLAGIDILLRLVAIVAVGFVVYGGFQYMTSTGEPDRTKKAKDTILNALVGLVICLVATSVVSFLGSRLS